MPDTTTPSRNELVVTERPNLPVPVPRPEPEAPDAGESWLGRMARLLFGWKAGSIRQDLEVVLDAATLTDTGFSPAERTMLKNVLGLRGRRVEDVMVPRADIIAVQQDIPLGELIKVFESAAHSRVAVYNDTLDDPVGMVHIRDFVAYMATQAAVKPEVNAKRRKPHPAGLDFKTVNLGVALSATRIVREILFVPPSMPVIDLFAKMQATRIHLSLVIDEYGGTEGLVSIEDIVEQVVGEIEDEHDEEVLPTVIRQRDGSFLADARTSLEEVVATLGESFDVGDAADEVDTLGGYLVDQGGPRPSSRRAGSRAGRLRDRGHRRRPAAGEEGPHLQPQEPRRRSRPSEKTRRQVQGRRAAGGRIRSRRGRRADHAAVRTAASPFRLDLLTRIIVTLTRLAHRIMLASGWRRAAIAFAAGALSVLALAPFGAWPVLFATVPVLVWLIDGSADERFGGIVAAAAAGWWFGFGYFLAGLYWIGIAFLVDAQTFGWLMPFAVAGLPAGLAVFIAAGAGLARYLWTRGPARVLALAVALTAAEWLRGHVLSGFPWNAIGYALTQPLALAQGAALVGLWGLTFVAVAVFATPAVLADDHADTRRPWIPLLCGLAVLAGLAGYGAVRLSRAPTRFVDGVRLRIVQPNLPQDDKFSYAARQEVMGRYLALSDRATGPERTGVKDVTHLIWPESAFPFFLSREPDALAQIKALLPPGTVLITGAARPEEGASRTGGMRAFNSVYVIDHEGSLLALYDKVHLVPFGEYLPLQQLLEGIGLSQLVKMPGGFLAGDRRRPLAVPRAPAMLPLVCYEVIFPGAAVPRDTVRPGWLVNLTNDGWFGNSTGPHQHFQQARVRAIEEGLPLVRAANTGISAVIDPVGRIVKELPLGTEGVLDSALPQPTAPTLYVRTGDGLAGLLVAGAAMIVIRRRFRRSL